MSTFSSTARSDCSNEMLDGGLRGSAHYDAFAEPAAVEHLRVEIEVGQQPVVAVPALREPVVVDAVDPHRHTGGASTIRGRTHGERKLLVIPPLHRCRRIELRTLQCARLIDVDGKE